MREVHPQALLLTLAHDVTYSNICGHRIGPMMEVSGSWWTFLDHQQQTCLLRPSSVQNRLYLFFKFVWSLFYIQW